MSEQSIEDMFESDDALIRIRPVKREDGSWDGTVSIGLAGVFDEEGTLNRMQRAQLMSIVSMMAAALPVSQQDDHVYDSLMDYLDETMPEVVDDILFGEDEQEEAETTYSKDGNVYHLSFDTPTKGSA
jgi:hypothetical protein